MAALQGLSSLALRPGSNPPQAGHSHTPSTPQAPSAAPDCLQRPHLAPADMRDALRGKVVILVGYPGSGKGTQGQMLGAYLARGGAPYPHLSTGALFRAEVAKGSATGTKMHAAMLAGVPIDDAVVFPYLRDALSRPPYDQGFMLDGFPKNGSSYDFIMPWLDAHRLPPLVVLHIDVPRSEVEARLGQRLHCRPCGTDYQPQDFAVAASPACAQCGGALERRDDDARDAIIKRLDTFDTHTAPLLARFRERGLLQTLRPRGTTALQQKRALHEDILRAISVRAVATLPQKSYHLSRLLVAPRASVFHNHVDARNPWVLTDILRAVQATLPQAQNKIYPVAKLVCGPQMRDPAFAPVYRALPNFHTIATHDACAVEAFSTGNMGTRNFDYAQVRATLKAAFAHPGQGVMTELEEEIFEAETGRDGRAKITLDRGLTPTTVDWHALAPWRAEALRNTPAFEMHHAVDLPKLADEASPPFAQEALMDATTGAGLNVGGWFLFAKDDRWALRSNEFSNDPFETTRARLESQATALRACVHALMPPHDMRPVTSRASLEKVHAIWRVD